MKRSVFVLLFLLIFASTLMAEYSVIYSQDPEDFADTVPCVYNPFSFWDFEGAEAFFDLEAPITRAQFVGTFMDEEGTIEPNEFEYLRVKFYDMEYQSIESLDPDPIIAPSSGEYSLLLYDDNYDGWGGAWASVFVGGVMKLRSVSMIDGGVSDPYIFYAEEGSEISVLYHPGQSAVQNSFVVMDPSNNAIAFSGVDTIPHSIGPAQQDLAMPPEWDEPIDSFDLVAEVMVLSELSGLYISVLTVDIPPILLESGWVSIQLLNNEPQSRFFAWINAATSVYMDESGDNIAYGRAFESTESYNLDLCYALSTGGGEETNVVIDINGNSSDPDVSVEIGGTPPEGLLGPDSGVPAVIYTLTGIGTHDITVLKPEQFTSDWYCWLQLGSTLYEAANPIPSGVAYWTFPDVEFPAKGNAVIVINDNSTLPVELSSFTATITAQNYVKIAWVAESETNHSGYNILRNETDLLAEARKVNPELIDEGIELGTQINYSYTDSETGLNMQYYYWLESVALDGSLEYFGPLMVNFGDPEADPDVPQLPQKTALLNAFPNPFNPATTISYFLAKGSEVQLDVFNTRGQLMHTYRTNHENAGTYYHTWDGCDLFGKPAGSGIYFYRMKSDDYHSTKKMVLSK